MKEDKKNWNSLLSSAKKDVKKISTRYLQIIANQDKKPQIYMADIINSLTNENYEKTKELLQNRKFKKYIRYDADARNYFILTLMGKAEKENKILIHTPKNQYKPLEDICKLMIYNAGGNNGFITEIDPEHQLIEILNPAKEFITLPYNKKGPLRKEGNWQHFLEFH